MEGGKFNLHDPCVVPTFRMSGRLSFTFEENNFFSTKAWERKAATREEIMLLKVLQNSQENTCARVSF